VAEPDKPKRSRLGSFFAFLLVLGLGGAVLYLSATINHRHYRLSAHDGHVFVERGRLLPMGFEPFVPEAAALIAAYAPIPVPPGETVKPSEIFEDRTDLDRGLFMTLSGWARARLDTSDSEEFELAVTYVQRAELLPGLSEEQRNELRTLRADLSLRRGKRSVADALRSLERAREEFETAIQLGAGRHGEAERLLAEVNRRLAVLRDIAPKATVPGGTDSDMTLPTPKGSPPAESTGPSDAETPRWRL
jgi:hypothetical protein